MFPHTSLSHSSNDTTNLQRSADRFTALGFIDRDLSLKVVTFKRSAQNLRQLPDHARFASRLVLVD